MRSSWRSVSQVIPTSDAADQAFVGVSFRDDLRKPVGGQRRELEMRQAPAEVAEDVSQMRARESPDLEIRGVVRRRDLLPARQQALL